MKQLIAWKAHAKRKPLILRGVRQTGKTHLLTQFGAEQFGRYHIVNFEKQTALHVLFEQDLDPQRIISELSFELKTQIDIDNDLVIFDEIQACPKAITSLKYFCEDMPQLALCSAGSLLGLHLNEVSYPVGKVDMLHLYPLTFSEFLAGIGEQMSADFIQSYLSIEDISELKHQRLWQLLKYYFITGGLPEVVVLFAELKDQLYDAMQQVRIKQQELIKAYYADIAKHAGKVNAMHIDRTWRAVPMQLASNYDVSTNRFRFKGIVSTISRYREIVNVIDWLQAAELVLRIPIVGAYEQPIKAYCKENIFKLMMFDVGLLGAMNDMDPSTILQYDYGTYKGYFAENFVAQQLAAVMTTGLYSWQEERSEVEFLMQYKGEIVPIEVKAGTVTRAKSLKKYIDKYAPTDSMILSANTPHQNKNQTVYHLPLYLTERLQDILC
ncbi:MAG: AAA family ATPase [Coxiellaceae bacterium]|nr:AAA family ATPase [Coxiellaceae bacterium]